MTMEHDKDNFPNGFESFVTTHHVMVLAIDQVTRSKGGDAALVQHYRDTEEDVEGLFKIAHYLTVIFEMHKQYVEAGDVEFDFINEIEIFIEEYVYPDGGNMGDLLKDIFDN